MIGSPGQEPGAAGAFRLFLNEVAAARRDLKVEDHHEVFYRGHSDCTWTLEPTLLRFARDKEWDDPQLRQVESDLFFEFQARANEVHDRYLGDYDTLFLMRHHGVATRLLDWTETLGVAIFFALRTWKPLMKPSIWVMNPRALNRQSKENYEIIAPQYLDAKMDYSDYLNFKEAPGPFGWDYPVALYPIQRNARLQAQRGYFTIHGNIRSPLDRIVPDVLIEVELPEPAIEEAREFLKLSGIDEYTMFPDLDGLQRSLHAKHRLTWS